MAKTFAELEKAHSINEEELLDTMENYVYTGSAINHRVVIQLLQRLNVTSMTLTRMRRAVQQGVELHSRPQLKKEYELVATFIN